MQEFTNPEPSILDSEVKLHRYWNLRGLIDASSNADIAGMLERKTSYISAVSGPHPTRAIGDAFAARMEAAFGLPTGAMDAPPDRQINHEDRQIAEVVRMMSIANDMDKRLIVRIVRQICGHSLAVINETVSDAGAKDI